MTISFPVCQTNTMHELFHISLLLHFLFESPWIVLFWTYDHQLADMWVITGLKEAGVILPQGEEKLRTCYLCHMCHNRQRAEPNMGRIHEEANKPHKFLSNIVKRWITGPKSRKKHASKGCTGIVSGKTDSLMQTHKHALEKVFINWVWAMGKWGTTSLLQGSAHFNMILPF